MVETAKYQASEPEVPDRPDGAAPIDQPVMRSTRSSGVHRSPPVSASASPRRERTVRSTTDRPALTVVAPRPLQQFHRRDQAHATNRSQTKRCRLASPRNGRRANGPSARSSRATGCPIASRSEQICIRSPGTVSCRHGKLQIVEQHEVLALYRLLADHHIEVWLDGGWGIDALVGEQTRPHADLDIAVTHDDVRSFGHSSVRAATRPSTGTTPCRGCSCSGTTTTMKWTCIHSR